MNTECEDVLPRALMLTVAGIVVAKGAHCNSCCQTVFNSCCQTVYLTVFAKQFI
jgi:hypothetical protein